MLHNMLRLCSYKSAYSLIRKKTRPKAYLAQREYYLVIIQWRSLTPMLSGCEHKADVWMKRYTVLLPPVHLNHVVATRCLVHPVCQTQRHKPAQLTTVPRIQSMHRVWVEVVVVRVTEQDCVKTWWQLVHGTRYWAVPLTASKLHWGWSWAEHRISEDADALHL